MDINIKGYKSKEIIYSSEKSIILKGLCSKDNKSVVFKILNREYPTTEELKNFSREYEIIRNLNIDGIIKSHGIEKYNNSLCIIFEDFEGESLAKLSSEKKFNLPEILEIFIQAAGILGEIHKKNIIHKDINPSNIIWNINKNEAQIIDFGISTMLLQGKQEAVNLNILEGTIAYVSPEQTGRMNRSIDYRTDFYSLGATFYEMLVGKRPFQSDDDMEIIHSHIAKIPVPPHKINYNIPPVISKIIIKLMEKNAEDRYQSSYGLKKDLMRCLEQIKKNGAIEDFDIGMDDFSKRFQLSQKLYGRDIEIQVLIDAFDRISDGKREILLVAGNSGIGKSVAVNEINKPITQKKGFFISGKFDPLQRNIPYSCLIQSFQDLVRTILMKSEDEIKIWKEKIISMLSPNSQLMIEVVPDLELIIGKQPKVSELPPAEAQNRLNRVMQCFISVFADKNHPLVMFLDDLQWADSPSYQFLENFMTGVECNYVLIIGAYRNNEVSASHPLALTIEKIEKANVPVNTIFLKPLEFHHINRLILDSIPCSEEDAFSLSKLCIQKTMGNPFFTNQLLHFMHENNFIEPDEIKGIWKWDIEKINKLDITDNVIDLMAGKIKKLPDKSQNVIKIASCIGPEFDLKLLSLVFEKNINETAKALWDVLREGLIVSEETLWIEDDNKELSETSSFNEQTKFRFLHDRVKEAAYAQLDENQKKKIHLDIGYLMLKSVKAQDFDEKDNENLFHIVNHINMGLELIDDLSEKINIAKMNLKAGKIAKSSAAFEPSYNYLIKGIELLPDDKWKNFYNLTLELYLEASEAAYLTNEFDKMDSLVDSVLNNAKSLLDKVSVYEVKISSFQSKNNHEKAVDTALEVLNLLGTKLYKNSGKVRVVIELLKIKLMLKGKKIDDLINLPEMTDSYKLASVRILSNIMSSSLQVSINLTTIVAFKILRLSIKYGNSMYSPSSYISYAAVLSGILYEIDDAYNLGLLALNMAEHYKSKKSKSMLLFVMNNYIILWKKHLNETLTSLIDAYKIGLENGSFDYAAYSAQNYCYHLFFTGKELNYVMNELLKYGELLLKLKQKTPYPWNRIYLQVILNLIGKNESPVFLLGESYDENEMVPVHLKDNDKVALFEVYFQKLILCYLFEEFDKGVENIKKIRIYLETMLGVLTFALFHFYESLTYLAIFQKSSKKEKRKILNIVKSNQKKMLKWADYAPMNFLNKYYLVEAEKARVLNDYTKASDFYDLSIEHANKNGYMQEEAMAKELAGRHYLSIAKEKIAYVYLYDAYYLYKNWGAEAKVEFLNKKYPKLHNYINEKVSSDISIRKTTTTTVTTSTIASKTIDMNSVIKASQAILGEIVLPKLLKKMMHIVIENAGAQKGILLLENEKTYLIQAYGNIDDNEIKVLEGIKFDNSNELSLAIVNYVIRTMQPVILNNATEKGKFTQDIYVQNNKSKSILCMPLINQGKLSGILYLENNLTTDAFTPSRLELLSILSSQIAISIDNALLYGKLENKNIELEKINLQISHLLDATKEMSCAKNKIIAVETAIKHLLAVEQKISMRKTVLYLPQKSGDVFNGYILWENNEVIKNPKPYEIDKDKILSLKNTNSIYVKDGLLFIPVQSEKKKLAVLEIERFNIDSNLIAQSYNIFEGISRSLALTIENLEAEENDRLAGIGSMAASIVHDLKNPIGVIMGYADMAGDEGISVENRKEYLSIISKEATRMSNMAHEVLEFSKGELNLILEVIDSKEYIDDIVKTLNPIFMNNDIAFTYSDDYRNLLKIDPDRVRRVILNLATNARDAMMGAKTENACFNIKIVKHDKGIFMLAEDNGPGIPEHIQATIFEPFVTYGKSHGTGLGMAIVKKIIEAHGGNINFETKLGKGTIFKIFLPVSESIKKVKPLDIIHKDSKPTATKKIISEANKAKVKILMAEDNIVNQKLILRMLDKSGYKADVASNGKEALKALTYVKYDIVLMDVVMPEMDGFEATTKIRAGDVGVLNKDTNIIAMTGHSSQEDIDKCCKLGMNGCVVKPIKPEILIKTIEDMIKS